MFLYVKEATPFICVFYYPTIALMPQLFEMWLLQWLGGTKLTVFGGGGGISAQMDTHIQKSLLHTFTAFGNVQMKEK